MKAAVLTKYGGPEVMAYEDVPDRDPGPGEILVRVAGTSINPVDTFERAGDLQSWRPLQFPAVIGWDVSGTVAALGAGVDAFVVGDRVCAWAYRTFAESCVAKAELFAKVPDGLDLADAGALPLVVTTGHQLISLASGPVANRTVLVSGAAGSVGRSAVATAKMLGATVIAGVTERQLRLAENIGADRTVALDDDAALAAIPPVDVVANTVRGKTVEHLLAKVKPWGRFASATGLPSNTGDVSNVQLVNFVSSQDRAILATMLDAVARGVFVVPIGARFPLEAAERAMSAMNDRPSGKIVMVP